MSVELNHLIVAAKDRWASARFLAGILGLEAGPEWGHFVQVKTHNGVTLDFDSADETISPTHYAFLVSEGEFDQAFARIQKAGVPYYADPAKRQPNKVNTHYGGRGLYFNDPSGHLMEIITRPYGAHPG